MTFTERMIGAARLDIRTYEEVEADRTATPQALAYLIGVYLLPEPATKADIGELLRTIGFSTSPGVLRIFAFVPILGPLLLLVVSIWLVMTMVVAVRQALDYESTLRAVAVCVIGWVISLVVLAVFGAMFFVSARSLLF
jgi:hypothetical protein